MNRAWLAVLILWGAFGLSLFYGRARGPRVEPRPIRIPLASFPLEFPGTAWRGDDRPLPAETVRIAHVSDYLSRRYTDGRRSFWLYVGYVPGWNPSAIHHPLACFPNVGLDLEQSEVVTIGDPTGPKKYSFNESRWWKEGQDERIYTLTTFYYNGKFEPSEWELRAERLVGIPYFAVITLSGKLETSLEETREAYFDLARRFVPQVLKHFPD